MDILSSKKYIFLDNFFIILDILYIIERNYMLCICIWSNVSWDGVINLYGN